MSADKPDDVNRRELARLLAALPVDDLQDLLEELWVEMTPVERERFNAAFDRVLADEAAGLHATH